MIDHLFDRDYQAGRPALNSELGKTLERFAAAFSNAFKVLNRIEYSAPWTTKPRSARCQ
jgi:hypothetical protein